MKCIEGSLLDAMFSGMENEQILISEAVMFKVIAGLIVLHTANASVLIYAVHHTLHFLFRT
jgi:hypothetical protein